MGRTRNTAQRQAIAKRLEELSSFVSAQQLHDDLAKSGSRIGLATVYRTLQVLLDEGEVDVLRTDSELLYRSCDSTEHHHHLVCRICGRTVEVAGPQIEAWARQIAAEADFVDVEHTAERGDRRLRTKRRASAHASGACVKTVNANREARRPFKAMSTPYRNDSAGKQEAKLEGVA